MSLAEIYADWDDKRARSAVASVGVGKKVAVANGVFDLLHAGHADLFHAARNVSWAGNTFVVAALNSDRSARRLKGLHRPYLAFADRARLAAALRDVDLVVGFDEDTPEKLLAAYRPYVLVKGEEYRGNELPGSEYCTEVRLTPMRGDLHTSELVRRIQKG
jgi:D-beta-D-heptose 7-phosphate kinase / D-beta-D-heptose 1-phosphate adenosyltransferase